MWTVAATLVRAPQAQALQDCTVVFEPPAGTANWQAADTASAARPHVIMMLVRHVSLIMKEHATSMEMPPRPVSFATDNCRALLMAINGDDNIMDRSTTAAVGASFDHQLVNLHFARILHRCFHMSVHAAGH